MVFRAVGSVLSVLLIALPAFARQGAAPKLDKSQRELLQSIVAAVDAASAAPETPGAQWQMHMLRTSDGSHYVAFTVAPPSLRAPQGPTTLYVRLATRSEVGSASLVERSAVMEWLKGMRSEPLVAQKRRGMAFGEMPVFGPGSTAARGANQQATDLALLGMERERARERREAAEKARRAALEGTASARARDTIHPFEDFSVDAPFSSEDEDGAVRLQRSISAGPGEYDLYVAWAAKPSKGQRPDVHVVKRVLALPPALTTDLALSSVIVADSVGTRDSPYPPDQQSSHPYSIGPLDIVPARDESFTNDQRLAIVFQVMNASANTTGKPDVAVGFRLVRVTPSGEQVVGTLNPQFYNATTLPADFDLTKGHPLFVAMAASLKTLARGEYRLNIEATDKLISRSTRADLSFRVVATPQTLLAAAPGAPPFRREDLLSADVLREVAARLRPAQPTAAMATALAAARDGKFIELLRDDASSGAEQGARSALKGIGLYALGDARIACTLLQQSLAADRNAATLLYVGACRALERNDRDAIEAWGEALAGEVPGAILVPLIMRAYLRLGEPARAREIAQQLVTSGAPATSIVSAVAAAHIAEGREEDAIAMLQPYLATHPDDLDAQYALLHALFAGFVRGQGVGATPDGQERFRRMARAYVEAEGRNAGAVREWMEIMP